jgi:lipoate-protein ligase A
METGLLYMGNQDDAAFWFAMEEYAQAKLSRPVWMLWSTKATLMIGRNQVISRQVRLEEVKKRNVALLRRSSGGGTIFTDPGTMQYSLILPVRFGQDFQTILKKELIAPLQEFLYSLGIAAEITGRNDLFFQEKKISGLAQYYSGGVLVSHGSLLIDANLSVMESLLISQTLKAKAKGVPSISSRVCNLKSYLPDNMTTETFRQVFSDFLKERHALTIFEPQEEAFAFIEKIRQEKYDSPQFIDPQLNEDFTLRSAYVPGGMIEIACQVVAGKIETIQFFGDFLALRPLAQLEEQLQGIPFTREAVSEALAATVLFSYLGTIDASDICKILFETDE